MGCWGVWLYCFLLGWLVFLLEKSKKDNGSGVFSSPLACSSSWGCLGALWAQPLVLWRNKRILPQIRMSTGDRFI